MPGIEDTRYLRDEQYRDASNFNARVYLHSRFSANKYGWQRWVFDRLGAAAENDVLEIGCGTGNLWVVNSSRVPHGWRITLSDLSPGMLAAARTNTITAGVKVVFTLLDAQALPFADGSLDWVVANHMLYHVPDRRRALAEIRRVLKPGGSLCAATNGERHLLEIREAAVRFDPQHLMSDAAGGGGALAFSLENGARQLGQYFDMVELHRYEDSLAVTESEPLVAYILSMKYGSLDEAGLRAALNRQLAADGVIHITKDNGVFIAR